MKKVLLMFFLVASYLGFGHGAARVNLLSEVQLAADVLEDYAQVCASPQSRVSFEAASDAGSYDVFMAKQEKEFETTQESIGIIMELLGDESNSMEDILCFLLRMRLEALCDRTEDLNFYFGERKKDQLVVPVLPFFYKKVVVHDAVSLAMHHLHQDQYEITEHLICLAYRACDPTKITGKTLELLKMSPQLWPRLAQETAKPLCIDACGGYAPLEKLWDLLPEKMRTKGNVAHVVVTYVWPAYKNPLKLREFFDEEARAKYQAFCERCDGELYAAYTRSRQMAFLKDATLGGKKGYVLADGVTVGEYWPPLETPPFLQRQIDAHFSAVEVTPLDLGPSCFSASQTLKEVQQKHLAVHKERADTVAEAQDPVPQQGLEGAAHDAEAVPSQDLADVFEEADPVDEAVVTTTAANAPSFVYPEGLRGKEVVHSPMPLLESSHGIGKFLDALFDSQRALSLSFKDVECAWNRIGGRVEGQKSGGSHRVFIAPDGRKLWGSYDHGGFGPKTIKYIQALFYWAGARAI